VRSWGRPCDVGGRARARPLSAGGAAAGTSRRAVSRAARSGDTKAGGEGSSCVVHFLEVARGIAALFTSDSDEKFDWVSSPSESIQHPAAPGLSDLAAHLLLARSTRALPFSSSPVILANKLVKLMDIVS